MNLDILKIASDTTNLKNILDFTHKGKSKNPMCGDEIIFMFKLSKNKIVDCGYEGKSCIYCQASASLLSQISINKKKSKIKELCDDAKSFFEGNIKIMNKWKIMSKLFKEKNQSRKECILLPFKAVKKIISL